MQKKKSAEHPPGYDPTRRYLEDFFSLNTGEWGRKLGGALLHI